MHIQRKLLLATHGHTLQLSIGLSVCDIMLVVRINPVSEKEEGVVTLHLPIEPLKKTIWVGASTEMRTQYLPDH